MDVEYTQSWSICAHLASIAPPGETLCAMRLSHGRPPKAPRAKACPLTPSQSILLCPDTAGASRAPSLSTNGVW